MAPKLTPKQLKEQIAHIEKLYWDGLDFHDAIFATDQLFRDAQ